MLHLYYNFVAGVAKALRKCSLRATLVLKSIVFGKCALLSTFVSKYLELPAEKI